jgi:predicted nucleic acid-binding protein
MSRVFVIDASVGVKLCLPEQGSDEAAALLSATDAAFHVPDLFYVECANVLWKHVRRGNCPLEEALEDLSDLRSLPLEAEPGALLAEPSLRIAAQHRITVYDACYAALAARVGATLVSADERLVDAVAGTVCEAALLAQVATR